MSLSLQLLGIPKIVTASEVSDLPLDKPASLLFYLALRGDWISRSELAFLYRPDAPEKVALSNVRLYIHRAKERFWAKSLEIEKFRVRYQVDTDVQAFEEALEQQAWSQALDLYRGSFLEGINLQDVPGYETWIELERQDLAQKWRTAALNYAHELEQQKDFSGAEGWLEKILKADPLDEECLQALLRVLFTVGKRSQALEFYKSFCQALQEELGVEPLETTRALFESMTQSEPEALNLQPPKPIRKHNVPTQTTRFVGRKRELAQLADTLSQSDCRLLSVVGLGGVGKTRLALELALGQLETFSDGVWFVPLAGVSSPDLLVSSIASALGFSFSGPNDTKDQLIHFLREKDLLLFLDNFEHLVEGAVLLEELLKAAPKLKLLATSRIALELSAEWLFDLRGLSYPPVDTEEPLESFDAVKLFNNRAERLSSTFVPKGETLEAIAALTRKVEGMPLALELAATWTRSLSVPQLLIELDKSFDVLSSQLRDLPERHRSLRNIFDYSWKRLSEKEQKVLTKLSIFQGGFTLGAAEQVAGTHLALLLSLINHSLIRRNKTTRFDMHPLVKQFSLEKLHGRHQVLKTVSELHATYYLSLVDNLDNKRNTHEQANALVTFLQELDNVNAAWLYAGKNEFVELLETTFLSFYNFLLLNGLFYQGSELFAEVISALKSAKHSNIASLVTKLQTRQAFFFLKTGDYTTSRSLLEACLPDVTEVSEHTLILKNLANLAYTQGDYREAIKQLKIALKLHETHNQSKEQQISTLFNLAVTLWAVGDYKAAKAYCEKSLPLIKQIDDKDGYGFYNRLVGLIASAEQDYEKAKIHYKKSLKQYEDLGNREQAAVTLSPLGITLGKLGDYKAQLSCHQKALEIFQSMKSQLHIALETNQIGDCLFRLGNPLAARQHYKDALQLALKIEATPIALTIMKGFARLKANTDINKALEILTFTIDHPATLQRHRDGMEEQLAELNAPKEQLAAARSRAKKLDLETLATQLLAQSSV